MNEHLESYNYCSIILFALVGTVVVDAFQY